MTTTGAKTQNTSAFRHTLATLAYRAAKVLRDTPPNFSGYRPAKDARSAGEILSHLCDLFDWALTQAQGKEKWQNTEPTSWEADSKRFFAALTTFDEYVASGAEMHATTDSMFQGAVADALTHVGQIALLRRLAGAHIKAENYSVAKIEPGKTGPKQNPAVAEYD
jgi:hypothetical protein